MEAFLNIYKIFLLFEYKFYLSRMKFEEKLRSMTGKDVVLAMVAGLRNPHTKIDMGTYGMVLHGVCYGCAATNAICEISGAKGEYVVERESHLTSIGTLTTVDAIKITIQYFEAAVDSLRLGDVIGYNDWVTRLGYSNLILEEAELPPLKDDYTEEQLKIYEDYANSL